MSACYTDGEGLALDIGPNIRMLESVRHNASLTSWGLGSSQSK